MLPKPTGLPRLIVCAVAIAVTVSTEAWSQRPIVPYGTYRGQGFAPTQSPRAANYRSGNVHSTINRADFNSGLEMSSPVTLGLPETESTQSVTPAALQSPEIPSLPNPTPAEIDTRQLYNELYPDPPSTVEPFPELTPTFQPFIAYQKSKVTATWLPGNADDLGLTDIDIRSSFSVGKMPGLVITPGYQMHFLSGPSQTDLPPRLYIARVQFKWTQRVSQQFGYEATITPGIYGDFENTSSDSFRFIGSLTGFYFVSPQTQLVFGAVYLDRHDISALPLVGFIHTPNEDTRLEVVFPNPKLSYRISRAEHLERWIYLKGEFGGGSWAVQRTSGANDRIAIRDWRMIVGTEVKSKNGRSLFVEAGWVFNRELEYESGIGDYDPDDAAMLRLGVTF